MARQSRTTRVAKPASTAAASSLRSIGSFGRVSKRVVASGKDATIKKDVAERFLTEQQKPKITVKLSAAPIVPTKSAVPVVSATQKAPASTESISKSTSINRKRRASDLTEHGNATKPTTISKRTRRSGHADAHSIASYLTQAPKETVPADGDAISSSDESVSQRAGQLLSRLNRQVSSSTPSDYPRSTSSSPRPASTAPTTPCEIESEPEYNNASLILPSNLLDLIRLQAAFVKAIALHHAHNGPSAPVDLRALCPSVAQSWGKRRVMLNDIQRCVGGLQHSSRYAKLLSLVNYGNGHICIELQPDLGSVGALSNHLNEAFEIGLRNRWAEALAARAGDNNSVDMKQFIRSLPKAPVAKSATLAQTSALRAKGQRSLEELMHGIALRKQEKEAQDALRKAPIVLDTEPANQDASTICQQATASARTPGAPMTLLDRIRFRQLQRTQQLAAGIAPPTPEELERKAALYRACDIAEVLSMLCTSSTLNGRQQSRVSFGMMAILTKLKDSLRLPISQDEGSSCVRLLAKEVAPEWIQIVSMAGREIVIMLTDYVPSKTTIQNRVESLSK